MPEERNGLSVFYWLVAGQAIVYIVLLRFYLGAIGSWPDVGSNFLGYWVLAILPASAVFAALVTWTHRRRVALRRERWRAFAVVVLAVDLILLFGSFAVYAAKLHR